METIIQLLLLLGSSILGTAAIVFAMYLLLFTFYGCWIWFLHQRGFNSADNAAWFLSRPMRVRLAGFLLRIAYDWWNRSGVIFVLNNGKVYVNEAEYRKKYFAIYFSLTTWLFGIILLIVLVLNLVEQNISK